MRYLRADTATTIVFGPAVDKTDGVTPETGLLKGTVDEIGVYKAGATSLTDLSAVDITAIGSSGNYYTTLATGTLDTEGPLRFFVRDNDVCLPVWEDFMVVNANVYDSLFAAAGTDYLNAEVAAMASNVITAASINADAITSAKIADDAFSNEHFAAGALTSAEITSAGGCAVTSLAGDVITAAAIADNAFSNEHFAAGALTSAEITSAAGCAVSSIGNNVITAASIDTDAIDADAIKADAVTEIQSGLATASSISNTNVVYESIKLGVNDSISFPLFNITTNALFTGTAWAALTNPVIECYGHSKIVGGAPTTYTDLTPLTNTPVEIGTSGIWYLELESGENQYDYYILVLKADEIKKTVVLAMGLDLYMAIETNIQCGKIDSIATIAPGSAITGSLLDRLCNKDGSKTYSATTDSLEALRDRGDAAWITATGFATAANLGTPTDLGSGATIAFMLKDMAGATFNATTDSQESIYNTVAAGAPGTVTVDGTVTLSVAIKRILSATANTRNIVGTAHTARNSADSANVLTKTIRNDGWDTTFA